MGVATTGRSRRSRRALGVLGVLAGLLALAYLGVVVVLLVGVRLRHRGILDAVRRFNRRWLNPAQLTVAGSPRWYASVVRHTGRRSGREYATPVWAEPTPDGEGYLVPLPYGTGVDWLRNLQAGGRASVTVRGHGRAISGTRVVGADAAAPLLPPRVARRFRFFGIDEYVVLLTDGSDEPADGGSAGDTQAGDPAGTPPGETTRARG